jgi:23S rRNA (cytidine1920-2'-O)/16S rRNA (cytidine1409-2'-O)-methyltransferase
MRLDVYIATKLWVSRNRAQFFVKQWKIQVNGKIITKVAYEIEPEDKVWENIEDINYVARSALKLKWFLEAHNIDIHQKNCIDVWASTWGFSQILLEKWANKIYAIDVGTSQLHPILQSNQKIISIENTDIRKFDTHILKDEIDIITCDISFISLSLVIDAIINLMDIHTMVILLFKPQFEVWGENLTKQWVPKNQKIIDEKLNNFLLILRKKWVQIDLVCQSKLAGEKGNNEFFILIK